MRGEIWSIIIAGPVILGLALMYALLRNKFQRRQVPIEQTEQAT